MHYKIVKPEVVNVSSAVWKQAKTSWWFWVIIVISGVELFFYGNAWLLLLALFYYMSATNKYIDAFWNQIAKNNGWQYKGFVDDINEKGIMFRQGKAQDIKHLIEGSVEGRPFRMFNYSFKIGEDKDEKTYWYTVFAFRFAGSFPHIYLNNKHNSYSISVGEKLSLPSEFEKQFILSAPRKYETEALEIFTPDVLTKLLDGGFTHDVELVDHELIMFIDGSTDNFKKLEKEFNRAMEIEDLFDEKLDKFKFEQIGNISHQLK